QEVRQVVCSQNGRRRGRLSLDRSCEVLAMNPSAAPRQELLALLQGCKEHLDEDAPRLVLADWLEEHAACAADTARAELIRLQCRMGQCEFEGPQWPALRQREVELVRQFLGARQGPLGQRGSWPLRGLDVATYPVPAEGEPLEDLLDTEWWAWVAVLRPWRVASEDQLRPVLASACLATVPVLDLSRNDIGERGAAALAGSPAVAHLEELNLAFDNAIG